MNPEVQTTCSKTYAPALIAKILKPLREQNKESDELNTVEEGAVSVPEIPMACEQILQDGGGFWDDVNGRYQLEDLVLSARHEEIAWVHSEGVYKVVPMQE